ncbi:MAG: RNA polymerase sigma factor [Thermoleophilia bacterium]
MQRADGREPHPVRCSQRGAAIDRRRTFEGIWEDCADAVFRYARRRAGEEGARDALAETFAIAWRRFDEVPADALPWLLGVCRRVLANQRRGEGRRRALWQRLAGLAQEPVPDPAERAGEAEAVRQAFRELSRRDRQTLALVAWDGLEPREAARVVGCSASAFTTRLHRARERLARRIEGHGPASTAAAPSDTPRQEGS